MSICGVISSGAVYDCDNPITPGLNSRVWLANHNDISSLTFNVSNKRLVEAIVFKTGGALYPYEGTRQSANATSEFVPQTLSSGFKHILDIRVFSIDSLQKLQLEKMCLGKIVGVVEHPNTVGNGDAVFEIFGAGVGLEVETLTRISRDPEGQGSYQVVLGTSDNEGQESTLPLSFLLTDYATSLALLEGYETPAA